jgi:hypothetical protein
VIILFSGATIIGVAGGSVSGAKPFVSQKMNTPTNSVDTTMAMIAFRLFCLALHAAGEPKEVDDFEDGYRFLQLRHFEKPVDLSAKRDLSLQFGHVLSDIR